MAERKKAIELIGSRQVAEREALRLTSAARAEKDASADRGAAVRAQAEADADADKINSMAMRVRAEIEAEALRMMNDATTCCRRKRACRRCACAWSRRPRASSASRCGRWSGSRASRSSTSTGSAAGAAAMPATASQPWRQLLRRLVNSALRYRAQAPLVDQLLREIGIEGGDIQRLVGGVSGAQVALPPGAPAKKE